jgi:hypothetical protein
MCRILLTIFLLFFTCSLVPAQLLIGSKAGGHLSGASFTDKPFNQDYKNQYLTGFHYGFVASSRLSELFYFHTELNFTRMRKSVSGKTDLIEFTNSAALNFIEMPVLVRAVHHINEFTFLYVNGGPCFNLWLGGRGNLHAKSVETSTKEDHPYKIVFKGDEFDRENLFVSEANRLQVGLSFGGGIVFTIAPKQKMMVDLRYYSGHTVLGKNIGEAFLDYREDWRVTTRSMAMSVAYLYDLDVNARFRGKSTLKK